MRNLLIGVVGVSNTIYTAAIAPTTTSPVWHTHPILPGLRTPMASPSALGSIWWDGTDFVGTYYKRTGLYVVSNDLGLFEIDTTNNTGTWGTAWSGPFFSPTGYIGSVGAITTTTGASLRVPRLFTTAGYPTFTLQEYVNFFGTTFFRDHIRLQSDPIGVGDSGIAIAETSGASDTYLGIQTGIDRAFPNPWKIRLRSSSDGGNSFDASDSVLTPFATGAYLSDPTVDSAGGYLHHSSLETVFGSGCGHTATSASIIYRRGTTASAIAAMHTPGTSGYVVESTTHDALDHPWIITTTDGSGTTVHNAYFVDGSVSRCNTTLGICYWKLSPGNVESGPVAIAPFNGALAGPARLIKGAGNEIYVYADTGYTYPSWTQLCTLKNAFAPGGVQSSDCTTIGNGVSPVPGPALDGHYVSVGLELPWWPENGVTCPPINNKKYACFETLGETAAAADAAVPYKVHVVYTALTNDAQHITTASTIYYTRSSGGGSWTTPVAITPTSGIYYDLIFPRFRGHPNWRDNAPGVNHGQTKEAT